MQCLRERVYHWTRGCFSRIVTSIADLPKKAAQPVMSLVKQSFHAFLYFSAKRNSLQHSYQVLPFLLSHSTGGNEISWDTEET